MLCIREAQMQAFRLAAEQRFVQDFQLLLDRMASEEGFERPSVQDETLFEAIGRARQHGLESVADVTTFLLVDVLLAPGFSDFPPLREILACQGLSPGERMQALLFSLDDEDWQLITLLQEEKGRP
jgi:hypothetical protein